jgi:hypothetical protein
MIYEETKDTPFVKLEHGLIEVRGRSISEDPKVFYSPVFDWIKQYVKNPADPTIIDLRFEYINTSSTKWVFNILKLIGEEFDRKKDIHISWYYENGDDDMLELGKIFESLVKRPFTFVETEE